MNKIIKLSFASFLAFAAVMSAGMGNTYAAGSATLGLSPNGASYNTGTTFSVNIVENSGGDSVNVVGADFVYDSSKLQFMGASCNSGAFEIQFPGSSPSGITCGTSTPKAGMQVVGSTSFKVLAAGSASISFASSSNIYRSTDNTNIWNGNPSGGNYNLATVAAAPVQKRPTPTAVRTAPAQAEVNAAAETAAPAEPTKPASQNTAAPAAATPSDNASNATAWIIGGLLLAAIAAASAYYLKKNGAMPKIKTATLNAPAATIVAPAKKNSAKKTSAGK